MSLGVFKQGWSLVRINCLGRQRASFRHWYRHARFSHFPLLFSSLFRGFRMLCCYVVKYVPCRYLASKKPSKSHQCNFSRKHYSDKKIDRNCRYLISNACFCVTQVKDLASVSLKQPVRIFVNSNTDVAPYLRQEFVRVRPAREGDREAIVAGGGELLLFFSCSVLLSLSLKVKSFILHNKMNCSLPLSDSAPHTDLSGPRDGVHSDQEAGPPHAHSPGPHGAKSRRTPRQPLSDAEVGESQVGHWLSKKTQVSLEERYKILYEWVFLFSRSVHQCLNTYVNFGFSARRFKDEQIDILVATDVAARGLDIEGVKTVCSLRSLLFRIGIRNTQRHKDNQRHKDTSVMWNISS